jgi:hypothetical protein
VIEALDSNGATTRTFASIPTDGDLIVLIAASTGAGTITAPAGGFTNGPSVNQGGTRPIALFWKVASAESGAAYTPGGATAVTYGAILRGQHATPVGSNGSNTGASVASLQLASSNLSITAGSYALGMVVASGSTTVQTFSNSFTLAPTVFNSGRYFCGDRLYVSGGASENTTASWTTARNVSGLLIEIKAA